MSEKGDRFKAMSDEEFKRVPPEEKQSCCDCGHLKPLVTLWCDSEEAIEARGTAIPGVILCPYWIPEKQVVASVADDVKVIAEDVKVIAEDVKTEPLKWLGCFIFAVLLLLYIGYYIIC